ncbi:MAG: EAL domain-containing protein [Nitratireductor sp.]|nr:EAL domain-containing protein [Nitratireductor sp.]
MRIRFWLYLFFGALSMLPVIFLGTWAQARLAAGPGEISDNSMLIATGLSLAVAALVSILLSHLISGPMERMHAAFQQFHDTGEIAPLPGNKAPFLPTEHRELEASFNAMADSLRDAQREMERLAFFDAVTGLPSRDAINRVGDRDLCKLANSGMEAVLFFIDIDNFKEVNDTHGHQAGDQVLRFLGSRIADIVTLNTGQSPVNPVLSWDGRNRDVLPAPCLARIGGDEFALFLPENKGFAQRDAIAEQILESVSASIPGIQNNHSLGCSIGAAIFPEHGLTFPELVKRADIAMYHVKNSGKSGIRYFGAETGEVSLTELRASVQQAILNDEMELFYQAKVDSETNTIGSVEALVRWIHPQKGVINPGHFIPAIENHETTNMLGEWVIRRACKDMKAWQALGMKMDIAVNIATRQFMSDGFAERIRNIVMAEGCEPSRFEIEVTEETALSRYDEPSDTIGELQKIGFKVSLDDYGRGYSNLSRLSELRVNTLKIDGPLTARLTRDQRTRVIFEATINMARGLGCKTVAEGVETAEEAAILRKLGCTELQGFYFSTPLPFQSFNNWLQNRQEKLIGLVA